MQRYGEMYTLVLGILERPSTAFEFIGGRNHTSRLGLGQCGIVRQNTG